MAPRIYAPEAAAMEYWVVLLAVSFVVSLIMIAVYTKIDDKERIVPITNTVVKAKRGRKPKKA
jgi:hypothetical protein